MKRLTYIIEHYFWLWCILATVTGLVMPKPLQPIQHSIALDIFLMGILFFTCLKIDFRTIVRELQQYLFITYIVTIILILMPFITYMAAKAVLPEFAIGFLILGAVPAGMAGGAFTDLCKGNVSLALSITSITSILCPFTIPPIVKFLSGKETSVIVLLKQSGMLMLLIFLPLLLSQVCKKLFPGFVKRHMDNFTAFSIVSLCLLILGAMARCSSTFYAYFDRALILLGGVFVFSFFYHILGFFAPIGRPLGDKVAISVNTAYINNGLAIVFIMTFFPEHPEAVLPAILVEFPMILLIVPLKIIAAKLRKTGKAQ